MTQLMALEMAEFGVGFVTSLIIATVRFLALDDVSVSDDVSDDRVKHAKL